MDGGHTYIFKYASDKTSRSTTASVVDQAGKVIQAKINNQEDGISYSIQK